MSNSDELLAATANTNRVKLIFDFGDGKTGWVEVGIQLSDFSCPPKMAMELFFEPAYRQMQIMVEEAEARKGMEHPRMRELDINHAKDATEP